MKVNGEKFLNHINKLNLGGLVNEAVLDKDLRFAVTDESKSVVSISNISLGSNPHNDIGIFDLNLFIRALQYAKDSIFVGDSEIVLDVVDNRLVFKKGQDEFKFLLSDSKVISNTIDNVDTVLKTVRAIDSASFKLTSLLKDKCLKAIQLITPETCTFTVQDGSIFFEVGKSNEHNIVIDLGKVKFKQSFSISLDPEFVSKVLGVLPMELDAIIELRKEMPVIIDIQDYTFLISPKIVTA